MLSHSSELGGGKSNVTARAGRAGAASSSHRGAIFVVRAGVALGGVSVIEPIWLVRLLGERRLVHVPECTAVHIVERTYWISRLRMCTQSLHVSLNCVRIVAKSL